MEAWSDSEEMDSVQRNKRRESRRMVEVECKYQRKKKDELQRCWVICSKEEFVLQVEKRDGKRKLKAHYIPRTGSFVSVGFPSRA